MQEAGFAGCGGFDDVFEVVGLVVWDGAGSIGVAGAGDEDGDVDDEADEFFGGGGEFRDVVV